MTQYRNTTSWWLYRLLLVILACELVTRLYNIQLPNEPSGSVFYSSRMVPYLTNTGTAILINFSIVLAAALRSGAAIWLWEFLFLQMLVGVAMGLYSADPENISYGHLARFFLFDFALHLGLFIYLILHQEIRRP